MILLDKIWSRKSEVPDFSKLSDNSRYDTRLFCDPAIQESIRIQGFARVSLFDKHEIGLLDNIYKEFEMKAGPYLGDDFLSSGRLNDADIRKWVVKSIAEVIDVKLSEVFVQGKADIFSGSFLVKPPSRKSGLSPHQDSSLTDEHTQFSVYGWTPLTLTDSNNGTLFVLPGSHLFGNLYRSLNIPWKFRKFEKVMRNHVVQVDAAPGEVIFFDSALIHGSLPNRSKKVRVAVNTFVKPAGTTFLHHFMDDSTPEGMIEEYAIDLEFFNTCNIMERPPERYRLLGMRDDDYPELDKRSFERMIQYFKPGRLTL